MNCTFRFANTSDKQFLINANNQINKLSDLTYSHWAENIDTDLFKDKVVKCLIAQYNNISIGFILYSYTYWANDGRGIYISNCYVEKEYRQKGVLKQMLKQLENLEPKCKFITNMVGSENLTMVRTMNSLGYKTFNLNNFYKVINKRAT